MNLASDPRTVMTLDAGGTNFRFSAIRGGKPIVEGVHTLNMEERILALNNKRSSAGSLMSMNLRRKTAAMVLLGSKKRTTQEKIRNFR